MRSQTPDIDPSVALIRAHLSLHSHIHTAELLDDFTYPELATVTAEINDVVANLRSILDAHDSRRVQVETLAARTAMAEACIILSLQTVVQSSLLP